jgi:hypothetical protein
MQMRIVYYLKFLHVLLRFTHKGATAGPKEMSYGEDKMSYEEAEPSQ